MVNHRLEKCEHYVKIGAKIFGASTRVTATRRKTERMRKWAEDFEYLSCVIITCTGRVRVIYAPVNTRIPFSAARSLRADALMHGIILNHREIRV